MSMCAKRSMTDLTSRSSSSGRPVWAAMAVARSGYFALIRAASSSRSACLRLERTTLAPCSASAEAIALPIPRLAPVTSATRPVRSNLEPSGTADTIGALMAVSGKAAEDILERIFQPTTKPSARDQAEETLRHPKRLVYVAMSNKVFYWRAHIQKFVLDSGLVPVSPFMLFDYYLMHTVSKEIVREAMDDLLARRGVVWVFGRPSGGVKVQDRIANRMKKTVRYFDIGDLPVTVMPITEETAKEELKD